MSALVFSALGPSIGEQIKKLGIKPTGMTVEQIDDISHNLTRVHIWGFLTDAEVSRARARLVKRAKFEHAEVDDE